jgi:hypothetical protein
MELNNVFKNINRGHYLTTAQDDPDLLPYIVHAVQLSRNNWITFSSYDENVNIDDMLEVAKDLEKHHNKEEAFSYVEKNYRILQHSL